MEYVAGSLRRFFASMMLFLPGAFWFHREMTIQYLPDEPLHTKHIGFAVAMMLGGAIVLQPSVGAQFTKIYVTVFPNGLPLLGGQRKSDPQPEQGDPK